MGDPTAVSCLLKHPDLPCYSDHMEPPFQPRSGWQERSNAGPFSGSMGSFAGESPIRRLRHTSHSPSAASQWLQPLSELSVLLFPVVRPLSPRSYVAADRSGLEEFDARCPTCCDRFASDRSLRRWVPGLTSQPWPVKARSSWGHGQRGAGPAWACRG